jgi:hypothetical protein
MHMVVSFTVAFGRAVTPLVWRIIGTPEGAPSEVRARVILQQREK